MKIEDIAKEQVVKLQERLDAVYEDGRKGRRRPDARLRNQAHRAYLARRVAALKMDSDARWRTPY